MMILSRFTAALKDLADPGVLVVEKDQAAVADHVAAERVDLQAGLVVVDLAVAVVIVPNDLDVQTDIS